MKKPEMWRCKYTDGISTNGSSGSSGRNSDSSMHATIVQSTVDLTQQGIGRLTSRGGVVMWYILA